MAMKLFVCSQCGDKLTAREVANETKVYVEGTAGTRVRNVTRQCRECHAANEYARQQSINSQPIVLAAKIARQLVADGKFATLSEALDSLGF